MGRDIQRIEVVPLIFDLRTMSHFKAHAAEDVQDRIHRGGNRMAASATGWQTAPVDPCRGRRACLFQVGFPPWKAPSKRCLTSLLAVLPEASALWDVFHHAHDT